MQDSLDLLQQANKAFNQSGKVGKSGKAAFNKALGDILRDQFASKAPQIAKFNKQFSRLYKLKDAARTLRFPFFLAAASAAGTAVASKLLPFEGGN